MELAESIQNLGGNKEYKPNRYWVSELSQCIRKAYYNRKNNYKVPTNGAMLAGTMFHETFPKIAEKVEEFKEAKYEVKMEYPHEDFIISGRADIVTPDCVYDIKFSGSKDISKHYKLQANAGALILNKPNYGVIIVNSRNLSVQFFKTEASADLFEIVTKKAEALHEAMTKDYAPAGPDYNWECGYCEWKKTCLQQLHGAKADWVNKLGGE